jgi:hypothetical protein
MAHAKTVPNIVSVDPHGQPTAAACTSILEDYYTLGYALFQLDPGWQHPSKALHNLAQALNLGEAFVPPLYRFSNSNLYDVYGVNTLTVVRGDEPYFSHPVFGSTAALELHTDGTLQEIDEIPTSVLFSVVRAAEGGETTIFQAVDAFLALQAAMPRLTLALLDDRALTKQATVNGSKATCTGPVFAYKAGELLTRYSVSDRDRWNVDEVECLLDAKNAMADLAHSGSPYYHQHHLDVGQGIILANNKVSHGRTGFSNSADHVRRMLRVLFARRPH